MEISYDHLQSGASSPYIILESKIPYYEVVTLTLPNYNSHMKTTRTNFLWKSENLLKLHIGKTASGTHPGLRYTTAFMMPYIEREKLHIIGIFRLRIGDSVTQAIILDSRISS